MSEMDEREKIVREIKTKTTKKIIDLSGVKYTFENNVFTVHGKEHAMVINVPKDITVIIENHILKTTVVSDQYKAICGTINRNINNAVMGIQKPYEIKMTLVGIGYKGSIVNDEIILNVGYSHPKKISIPEMVKVVFSTPTKMILSSISKQAVGDFAAILTKRVKPYNVYSGKGILIDGKYYQTKEKKKK